MFAILGWPMGVENLSSEHKVSIESELRSILQEIQDDGWLQLSFESSKMFSYEDAATAVTILLKLERVCRLAALLFVDKELEITEYSGGKLNKFVWSLVEQLQHLQMRVEAPGLVVPKFATGNSRTSHPIVTDLAIEIAATCKALVATGSTENDAFKRTSATLSDLGVRGYKISTIRSRYKFYESFESLASKVDVNLEIFATKPFGQSTILRVFKEVVSEDIVPNLPSNLVS